MALITRSANASMDTSQAKQLLAGEVFAGENLDAAAPCYIKSSDGKVYMGNGTAANEAAEIVGFTPRAYQAGEPVTLFGQGTRFRYGSALTPGDVYFLAATAGRLDSVPTAGDSNGMAVVVSATDIVVLSTTPNRLGILRGVFVSAEQTGTGAAQNVAHGLGVAPSKVVVAPTDLSPATVGQYTVVQGAHDATNVIVTVTSGKKFVVMAWA